ncbi:OsmC family protein [Leifsonia shinshuensis]|uniref:Organic hydroperoxide reductase OsmC/OhrA n=1 Tax=Leifsonia shinshuensis TaxID=150026 RepID=A0A853CTN3_9MICO|nr:OsmC family protein [Leifsonia shinshuensis]NYJ24037.1 organic hydroperoxide reductase OsmC/OhrA [Leifsonia shinshuensis]
MKLEHRYAIDLQWTGNRGEGTSGYKAYGRDHTVSTEGKHPIEGSADRAFFGDTDRWNPEELLLAALSQCHMLSYLAEAARSGLVVVGYTDAATGVMEQTNDGGGHFTSATLRPKVTIADPAQAELAASLHAPASQKCFIAASVNFPVGHEPEILTLA